ncbi:MAG: ROK family glucokinase [Holdemanella sp.]|nr:ROK family glucokinase [Holdemanella sp.]
MKTYAFGVDIGGTTVKIGLFNTSGALLEVWEIPTRTEDNGKNILSDINEAITKKMEENNITKEEVQGIGMGVPGPVGDDGTVFNCVNLGWPTFNVKIQMEALSGIKVGVGNDANVAALGEMWQGGGKGYKDLIMITLGTGVGGGVIVDGKVIAGANGGGGEIGHINVNEEETEVCGCGKKGCLEQYTSASGLLRVTKRYLASHPDEETVLRQYEKLSTKEICKAAEEGDAVAVKMMDLLGKTLGKGLATVATVTNPAAFIIGGGLSNAGAVLMEPIEKWYKHYCFHNMTGTEFKRATLGNSAGIYGGVQLVLE